MFWRHHHWRSFWGPHFRMDFGPWWSFPGSGWMDFPYSKEEELEWLKRYTERLEWMKKDLEKELSSVEDRIAELEK